MSMFSWSRSFRNSMTPFCSISNGTWYMELRSCMHITWSGSTWQKLLIFCFTSTPMGFSDRQTIRSGLRPHPRSSLTELCVGFVLGSPVALGSGTRDTCARQKFSRFTRNWNCLKASTKGMPSMSPMVPPSSMMQTCGFEEPCTGVCATFSTHSCMASVMCGTTKRGEEGMF